MELENRTSASFHLSTCGVPPSQGLLTLQELFDRKVQLKLEASADQSVDARMTVHGLPGLRRARMVSTMDTRLVRNQPMLSDGEDDVCLIVKMGGHLSIGQRRQQTTARTGDGVLLVYREPATLQFLAMNYSAIRVPMSALAPMTRNVEASAAQSIRRETAALQLLQAYLSTLPAAVTSPQLSALIATHVYDLMALAIGATRDGQELASQRGLRAARLQAVKMDLAQDAGLSLDQIARRQGVSPRYVQKLFEETGTTLTQFALELRLESARKMLASPRFADWSVLDIALEAGFGDLSYFNRRFKQHYSMTPSEMRAQSACRTSIEI